MMKGSLKEKIASLPEKPGVYIFKDSMGRVLYVGKAKNLRSRVKSYFTATERLDPRRQKMVTKTEEITFTVTDTEVEALALEANLIKQYKPRYNIILRDDKNYPYLRLGLNDPWPTLEVVRRVARDGALYFGPFIPAASVWETLSFIRRHFGIRPCRYRLDRPMRPCVQYQMKRCPAPCAGLVDRDEYMKEVREVERFLRGQRSELIEDLTRRMELLAEELRFEEAAKVRDRIRAIRRSLENQKVVAPELGDMDVIAFYQEGSDTLFQVFFIRRGILISTKDFYLKNTGFLTREELLEDFIKFFYAKDTIPPEGILLQHPPSSRNELQQWLTSKRGEEVSILLPDDEKKKEIIEMAVRNARLLLQSRSGKVSREILESLKERLSLKAVPSTIGAFDVSTVAGAYSVGAFIWWEDGEFKKDLYRHLRIRTVKGVDDYSMMAEIVKRTLKGMGENIPDLIIIDGGRAHLATALRAATEVLGEGVKGIDFLGVAKAPDRAILPDGREIPIVDTRADSLLLRRIRDEVHRFAISFHRKIRAKDMKRSRLDMIKGIGKKRKLALLRTFGSVEAISMATVDEIAAVEGMNRRIAEHLLDELNKGGQRVG